MTDAPPTTPTCKLKLDTLSKDPMWNAFSSALDDAEEGPCKQEGTLPTSSPPPNPELEQPQWPLPEGQPSNSSCTSSHCKPEGSSSAAQDSCKRHIPLRQQMSSTLRQDSSRLPMSFSQHANNSEAAWVWAWLEAADESMPNAVLRAGGLAIGSSYTGFEAKRQAAVSTSSTHSQKCSLTRRLAEVKAQSLRFLEIEDRRISSLHCIISADYPITSSRLSTSGPVATIEDVSKNGTFINGKRLAIGERVSLNNADRISLVLSLSPMVERALIFRTGNPFHDGHTAQLAWKSTSPRHYKPSMMQATPCLAPPCPTGKAKEEAAQLDNQRTSTSLYTTADSSNPSDLICQICLGLYRSCVALQPCGHSFCATCLSHYFAAALQGGQALNCPLRCEAPQRVVINFAVRQLIRMHHIRQPSDSDEQAQKQAASLATVPYKDLLTPAAASSRQPARTPSGLTEDCEGVEAQEEEDSLSQMSPICPIWDGMLPLDASALKLQQVEHYLKALRQDDEERLLTALERLAGLAWNDKEVRGAVLSAGGVDLMVDIIHKWIAEPTVLCNACLCLMSLVRGEGSQSQTAQWQVANAHGVEALVAAANAFPESSAVQLSVMLCVIPLSLDNTALQLHVAHHVLCSVVAALRVHIDHPDVQAKGLVVLGVLGQGDGVEDDKIRQKQLALGVTARIAEALKLWGSSHEEVLWSVLFSLAVLVKDGNAPFQPAIRSVAAAGIPNLLEEALQAYKEGEPVVDEMILSAGAYMLEMLQPAATDIVRVRSGLAAWALTPILRPSNFWPWGMR